MPGFSIDASALVQWNDETAQRWQKLLQTFPEALDLSCDVYGVQDVRGLLKHVFAVELRYSERLSGLPVTAYEDIPSGSADLLFGLHRQAMSRYHEMLADPGVNWQEQLEFQTLSAGTLRASRQKVLIHAMLHGIRHYAQMATLVRQSGIKPDWPMDFLMSGAMD